MTPAPEPKRLTVSQIKEQLSPFLTANPLSFVKQIERPEKCVAVTFPWGDESFVIKIPDDSGDLIDALNNVYLPAPFTAIWHTDSKDLEVIWTSYPLPEVWSDLLKRKFTFRYRERNYQCEFSSSSQRLLVIAENFLRTAQSFTVYRNLSSFQVYALADKGVDGYKKIKDTRPFSFWIKGIKNWDDSHAIDLVNHLNFYMIYYDTITPYVFVWHTRSEEKTTPQTRFPFGDFPKSIQSRPLDSNLFNFWEASRSGDAARRFLYNYQILEYASFHFLESSIFGNLKKVLSAPNVADRIDVVTQQVVEIASQSNIYDLQKIEILLRNVVDPNLIWTEIEKNIVAFSKPMKFDGGYIVKEIVKADWKADDFRINWVPVISGTFRGIRNALSHGKESRTATVITPTVPNLQRLRLWVPLIAVAAREVMVYHQLR